MAFKVKFINGWVHIWLTSCVQPVYINGYQSSFADVQFGVPQGTVLGPLVFLLYMNDNSSVSYSLSYYQHSAWLSLFAVSFWPHHKVDPNKADGLDVSYLLAAGYCSHPAQFILLMTSP